ncbi:ABC transporter ATP-binding protein [Hydrogenophaga laconesensis]|uniref:ABC-type branched-subunit amino acid transport system ATPase component n=1 Tax=Hydrogenophaga laconesensis TaxID=1805971 RepID=A0ABU1VDB1_9BURK|nr:ABC transporter ATP-binding protein [Hydrogenophaga laconesensis]MDR7095340.1 ABC-type branched-subunit amino acid transport system ATPase component [Hydrogenophaga laconesensis]
MRTTDGNEILRVDNLDVFFGKAHVLQQVSLALPKGVLAVVGRNGMGKTTLCRAITGMVPARGSVRFNGREVLGLPANQITHAGIGYVPQGRRVWRSLTVDETLRLASGTARQGAWTLERVYQTFPRLAERRGNGGAQLSGGEQQMLAIGRALLFNPSLLVMDEPTEGLAPVIVEQVATLLRQLADDGSMSVLLIEQNLGVALEVADRVAIMVNGRIAHELPAAQLAADPALQQRMLGLRAGASQEADTPDNDGPAVDHAPPRHRVPVLRVVRSFGHADTAPARVATPTRVQAPAVYLAGAFVPGDPLLTEALSGLERSGSRVVTLEIGDTTQSTAQVRHAEIMGYAREPEDALRAYLRSRGDIGALLVIAHGTLASRGLATAQALPTELPRVLVTDRPLPQTPADLTVLSAPPHGAGGMAQHLVAGAVQAITAARHDTDIQRMRRTQP